MLVRFLFFFLLINSSAYELTADDGPQTPKTSPSLPKHAFDAVSAKHLGNVLTGRIMPRPVLFRNGRLTARETLDHIVAAAFHLSSWEYEGPNWLSGEYYDIEAIAPAGTTEAAWEEMLQAMLKDRFGLKYHRETRQIPIYAITPGKGGITLPSGIEDPKESRIMRAGIFQASSATVHDLASFLTYCMDRPVFDLTGATAKYRMRFDWSEVLRRRREDPLGGGRGVPPLPVIEAGDVSSALRRFGLQLESRKTSANILIVDNVKIEPTPN
jgi:uncharacterized protein (TIGR03435 family)